MEKHHEPPKRAAHGDILALRSLKELDDDGSDEPDEAILSLSALLADERGSASTSSASHQSRPSRTRPALLTPRPP